jgi:uncharacterized membrane protein YccC
MDRQTFRLSLRTTVAAIASLLAARACGLPEVYWAVITTVVVMQSTLGAAWDVSLQRLIGTLLGGIAGAALGTLFASGPMPFIAGMLAMGLFCAVLRLQMSAYRFTGVTLAIILLPEHAAAMWIVALHRFLEVTFGIVVAMAVMAIWPEPDAPAGTTQPTEGDQPTADLPVSAK